MTPAEWSQQSRKTRALFVGGLVGSLVVVGIVLFGLASFVVWLVGS